MTTKYVGAGLDIGGALITNSGSPSGATDLTNKSYVDNLVNGLEYKNEVRAASTGALTLASGFTSSSTIDGVALALNDRILIKNQAAPAENGIYIVTAGTPTRALDADATAELNNATVFVTEGTTLGGTQWTQTTKNPTVGSSSIVFTQITTGTSYTASLGITLSGSDFRLDTVAAGNGLTLTSGALDVVGDASITVTANQIALASGVAGAGLTLTTGVLAVVAGDTSITVAADSVAVNPASGGGLTVSSGLKVDTTVARVYSQATNANSTTVTVTHSLGIQLVDVAVMVTSTGERIFPDITCTSTSVVTLTFGTAPTLNSLTIKVFA